MSRHGPSAVGRFDVATSFLGHDKGGWPLVSRPRFVVATWPVGGGVATPF